VIEYTDGQFSEPTDFKDLLKDLCEKSDQDLAKIRAIHVGASKEELEGLQELRNKENGIETRFAMVQSHIEGIELDINKILIHLGLDDKGKILPVKP